MFYIEKNDKPNFIEKKLNIIKLINNKIIIPIAKETNEKQKEKLATKTKKVIEKNSNSKKVVLDKQIQKEGKYINYLNALGIEIQNGRWLFEILLPDIVEYIIKKQNLETNKCRMSILINDLTDIEYENIKILSRKYKMINIVTNHIEKFKNLEKSLNEEGIIITITNNKKKSLSKSKIILNIDFPKELMDKYNIQDDAIIVNLKGKIKINKKRFNGLSINDYEIDYREDKKQDENVLIDKYYLKDLYEAKLYKKQRINEIKEKIKLDKVVIKKLVLNNGEI